MLTSRPTALKFLPNTITIQSKAMLLRHHPSPKDQHRTIMSFVKNALALDPPPSPNDPTPENRFHPWIESPSRDLRDRAARIMKYARCPVTGKEIRYTCPLSGIPTHHSREAWEQDEKYHKDKIYEILKKVNIYEHDLRSGRAFPEFDFPEAQEPDKVVNMSSWDLFFYTRGFYSMDTEFQLAAVTKMLSYPMTIAGILSQYSPYALNPKGPVTLEGLKSLAALRYTLYSNEYRLSSTRAGTGMGSSGGIGDKRLLKNKPMRLFILGARAESQLPGYVWKQLQYLFPTESFEIFFIGPESFFDRDRGEYIKSSDDFNAPTKVIRIDDTLKLLYYTNYFHFYHNMKDFYPYDPFTDCFFIFHPGFASPENRHNWLDETMGNLLDTKCPIFVTGFNKGDISEDLSILNDYFGKDLDSLMEPTENVFGSTKWELNDLNPHEVYQFNKYVAGFRGKRYHTTKQHTHLF